MNSISEMVGAKHVSENNFFVFQEPKEVKGHFFEFLHYPIDG